MNIKLTTPKAILIGSLIIAGTILYTNGFNFSIIPEVKADYHWADSIHDHYQFYDILDESSVRTIVNDCSVHVDGDYGSISC